MYENLSREAILDQARQHPFVMGHLPCAKELDQLPRQFLINVCFTLLQDQFSSWVNQQVALRNEARKTDKNLMIELDEQVAQAFREAAEVSVSDPPYEDTFANAI